MDTMKFKAIYFGCVCFFLGASVSSAYEQATKAEALEQLVSQGKEVAAIVWEGVGVGASEPASQPTDTTELNADEVNHQFTRIVYAQENIDAFADVLGGLSATGKDGEKFASLHVANRLIYPLLSCDVETVSSAMEAVREFQEKFNQYLDLPEYSKREIARFQMPDETFKGSDAARKRAEEKAALAQNEKKIREMKIEKFNEQVCYLKKLLVHLLAHCGGVEEDNELVEMFVQDEEDGLWDCFDILNVIEFRARGLSAERAAKFYEKLVPISRDLRWTRKIFVNKTKLVFVSNDNSSFFTTKGYPGRALLMAINQISPVARTPALTVPTKKQVDKYIRNAEKKEARDKKKGKKN